MRRRLAVIMVLLAIMGGLGFVTNAEAKHKTKHKAKRAAVDIDHGSLSANINALAHQVGSGASMGIIVKSMKTGRVLYAAHEEQSLMPASTLKISTAAAALATLGPHFTFDTLIATDTHHVSDGVVYGNLYVVYSGDPLLNYPDLSDLIDELRVQHLHKIKGNVYLDFSVFDQSSHAPGWNSGDQHFCFAAPIMASIVDHNCLPYRVMPATRVGALARVMTNTQYFYTPINNSVLTRSRRTRGCFVQLNPAANGTMAMSGCIAQGMPQTVSAIITDPIQYNLSLIRTALRQEGIMVSGTVIVGSMPLHTTVLAVHHSEPLNELITKMLKKSDNVIAGALFKKIGQMYYHTQGTWATGSRAVTTILQLLFGVNTSSIQIVDGSGLSRYNKITPVQLLRILDYIYHNTKMSTDFIDALPIAGVDGTLKHRMQNIRRQVRAKTGTISGVNALAGYVMTKHKEPLAFVIIVNGNPGYGWRYKSIEDKIVTLLAKS